MSDVRALAAALAPTESPGDNVFVRRGAVTAISATSATVTIGGKSIPNVPFYKHVVPAVSDNVDVLFDNATPVIIGVVGGVSWTAPTLGNSWAIYDLTGLWAQPGYYKDASGRVHLRGSMTAGTIGAVAFQLPTGFRPTTGSVRFPSSCWNSGPGWVTGTGYINTNGQYVPEVGQNGQWTLDGISFYSG